MYTERSRSLLPTQLSEVKQLAGRFHAVNRSVVRLLFILSPFARCLRLLQSHPGGHINVHSSSDELMLGDMIGGRRKSDVQRSSFSSSSSDLSTSVPSDISDGFWRAQSLALDRADARGGERPRHWHEQRDHAQLRRAGLADAVDVPHLRRDAADDDVDVRPAHESVRRGGAHRRRCRDVDRRARRASDGASERVHARVARAPPAAADSQRRARAGNQLPLRRRRRRRASTR
jgi:hypothetical protein